MRRLTKLLIIVALILVVAATSTFFSTQNFQNNNTSNTSDASERHVLSAIHSDYTQFPASNERPLENVNYFIYCLARAQIELIVPEILLSGNTLFGRIVVSDVRDGVDCLLTWYLDDEVMLEEWITIGEDIPLLWHDFEYTRTMAETATVRVTLQHTTRRGDEQEITAESIVELENHGISHWIDLEAERVLETVSSRYAGDRTLEWALENDYDEFDKVVFVNAMGYESTTDYLLWVNRSHQRVNVFEKCYETDTWELIEEFIVATGGWNTMTRRGVTTIPSRSAEGWHFSDPYFFVRPVVRFFPGTGYAFHSRPFSRVGVFRDERIGFPVSAGCIRMYCDDIWYIYNNIPDGTTVVIH